MPIMVRISGQRPEINPVGLSALARTCLCQQDCSTRITRPAKPVPDMDPNINQESRSAGRNIILNISFQRMSRRLSWTTLMVTISLVSSTQMKSCPNRSVRADGNSLLHLITRQHHCQWLQFHFITLIIEVHTTTKPRMHQVISHLSRKRKCHWFQASYQMPQRKKKICTSTRASPCHHLGRIPIVSVIRQENSTNLSPTHPLEMVVYVLGPLKSKSNPSRCFKVCPSSVGIIFEFSFQ